MGKTGQQRLKRPPSESSAELVVKSRVPAPEARINLVLPTPTQLPVTLSTTYYTLLAEAPARGPRYIFWEGTAPVVLSTPWSSRGTFS